MREFRFRIWNLEEKRWEEPQCMEVLNSSGELCSLYDDEYKKTVIQQFTGLTDTYNKELYEGDIVETIYAEANKRGEIVFDVTLAAFRVKCGTVSLPLVTVRWGLDANATLELVLVAAKKIGNIFENPELLNNL